MVKKRYISLRTAQHSTETTNDDDNRNGIKSTTYSLLLVRFSFLTLASSDDFIQGARQIFFSSWHFAQFIGFKSVSSHLFFFFFLENLHILLTEWILHKLRWFKLWKKILSRLGRFNFYVGKLFLFKLNFFKFSEIFAQIISNETIYCAYSFGWYKHFNVICP